MIKKKQEKKMGALSLNSNSLKIRPWTLKKNQTRNIIVNTSEKLNIFTEGSEIVRILSGANKFIENTTRYLFEGLNSWRINIPLKKKKTKWLYSSWLKSFLFISIKVWFASFFKECKRWLFTIGSVNDKEFLVTVKLLKNILSLNIIYYKTKIDRTDYYYYFFKKIIIIKCINNFCFIGCNIRLESSSINLILRKKSFIDTTLYCSAGSMFNETLNNITLGLNITNYVKYIQGIKRFCCLLLKNVNLSTIYFKLVYKFFGASIQQRLDSIFFIKLADYLCNVIKNIVSLILLKYKFIFSNVFFFNNIFESLWKNIIKKNWSIMPLNSGSLLFNNISLNIINDISYQKPTDIIYICNEKYVNLKTGAFTIYQGHNMNWVLSKIDIILPTKNFFEKMGTYLNIAYKKVYTNIIIGAPNLCRSNHSILNALVSSLINFTIFVYKMDWTKSLFFFNKKITCFIKKKQTVVFSFEVESLKQYTNKYYNQESFIKNAFVYFFKTIIWLQDYNLYDLLPVYNTAPLLNKLSCLFNVKTRVYNSNSQNKDIW